MPFRRDARRAFNFAQNFAPQKPCKPGSKLLPRYDLWGALVFRSICCLSIRIRGALVSSGCPACPGYPSCPGSWLQAFNLIIGRKEIEGIPAQVCSFRRLPGVIFRSLRQHVPRLHLHRYTSWMGLWRSPWRSRSLGQPTYRRWLPHPHWFLAFLMSQPTSLGLGLVHFAY